MPPARAGKSTRTDEPRSPLSLRPLFEWEKSLAKHLVEELSLQWSTSRDEAGGSGGRRRLEIRAAGTREGRSGPDRGRRELPHPPRRHPEAVPECLLGALLPPVRLSCVPFAFVAGGGGGGGRPAGKASKVVGGAESFPRVGISEAGRVEVEGGAAGGLDGVEGEWAAKTLVDSFLPVSLLVHNASPWPVDVIVEVTSTYEGAEEEGSRSWGDDVDDDAGGGVMWSGMPRRHLGKLAPGRSMCHGLLGCFLAPGNVSVGFTCRVKVESASAPYGSATYTSSSSLSSAAAAAATAGAAAAAVGWTPGAGVGEAGDDWHPVACHLPLSVSVLPRASGAANGADGTGQQKAQVHRVGPRIGGVPADCNDASAAPSGSAAVMEEHSDVPPAGLERL